MYLSWIYALSVVLVGLTLPIFSYLTLIYRELGRMTTGRVHEHLDIFEAEIEPKLKINRRSGGRTFRILGHFWLAFLVLETTRGVVYFVPSTWESLIEFCVFVILEVVFAMHFIPDMLLYRTTGRWLLPLLPLIRSAMWLVWPVRVFLEGAESLARISEQEAEKTEEQRTEEGIEALVEAAEEEGIIEPEQADLIEQVVEFSDKRVREVMTPRPDIVAISAEATLEELHAKVVETKFSKIPVYEKSEMPKNASGSLIPKNQSINEIYATNDLDEEQDFVPVIDAIQGEGFNPLWRQILIVFNPGFTPHQFFSADEVEEAALGANPEITLIETDEVYR